MVFGSVECGKTNTDSTGLTGSDFGKPSKQQKISRVLEVTIAFIINNLTHQADYKILICLQQCIILVCKYF